MTRPRQRYSTASPRQHIANAEGWPACGRKASFYARPAIASERALVTCGQCKRVMTAKDPLVRARGRGA